MDAWLKPHPGDRAGARHLPEQMMPHLGEFGVGWIAAQAWSVAEWLRCWVDCSEKE